MRMWNSNECKWILKQMQLWDCMPNELRKACLELECCAMLGSEHTGQLCTDSMHDHACCLWPWDDHGGEHGFVTYASHDSSHGSCHSVFHFSVYCHCDSFSDVAEDQAIRTWVTVTHTRLDSPKSEIHGFWNSWPDMTSCAQPRKIDWASILTRRLGPCISRPSSMSRVPTVLELKLDHVYNSPRDRQNKKQFFCFIFRCQLCPQEGGLPWGPTQFILGHRCVLLGQWGGIATDIIGPQHGTAKTHSKLPALEFALIHDCKVFKCRWFQSNFS